MHRGQNHRHCMSAPEVKRIPAFTLTQRAPGPFTTLQAPHKNFRNSVRTLLNMSVVKISYSGLDITAFQVFPPQKTWKKVIIRNSMCRVN